MMDRNLGATYATDFNNESIRGLLYQWGRKDPFVYNNINLVSGPQTTAYSIEHPTSFICSTSDWNSVPDNTLWNPSKSIYDPCPPGYRVPNINIWKNAGFPSTAAVQTGSAIKGRIFTIGGVTCIYPASGVEDQGGVAFYNEYGGYWSCEISTSDNLAHDFTFKPNGVVNTTDTGHRGFAGSVRCLKIE